MRSGVSGLASTALAISPATSARSSWFASSSGTFSVLPLVLRVSMRRRGSCALTTSAKATPNTGKPPPGVAVPRANTKNSSISLRRKFGVLDDLLVDVDLAAHELGEILGLHRRGLDAELGELLLDRRLEHDRVHRAVQLLHHRDRRRRRRPHAEPHRHVVIVESLLPDGRHFGQRLGARLGP